MSVKQKILILQADSNGCYPIPAVKGGAVSTLVEHLVEGNNKQQLADLTIMSYYNKKAAKKAAASYPNIHFIWVKRPIAIRISDWVILHAVKLLMPKKKLISFISIASLLWYIWKASRILKKNKFDKIVLQNNMPLAWAIKLSKYDGEYFYHLHNTPRTNVRCQEVFDNCTAYLCVSQSVGDDICSPSNPIGPVPREKIRILFNCIETDLFKKQTIDEKALRERLGIGLNDHIIAYVGRLSPEKGVDKLIKSLEYVKTKNVKVFIVGAMVYVGNVKDQYQQELVDLTKQYKDQVSFTGYIPQSELPKIYNIADLSVLPSMWDEPAGLTMIESMACGTPVITTNSGGIPEYVGDCAVVLDRNDDLTKNIAINIDRLLNDKVLYDDYSQCGIKRIRDNFSSEDYINRFCEAIGI